MPNIIITELCNLSCPYCFANKMIEDGKNQSNQFISLDQLDQILNWLLPTAITEDFTLGLIGGEPTLHPQFNEILNKINAFNSFTHSQSTIFTNGLKIHNWINDIGISTSLLINVNNLNNNLKSKLINNLDLINNLNWFDIQKATLGCNLYFDEKNYQYFWDIVDRYPKIHKIRMAVAAPNSQTFKKDKNSYYLAMKDLFLHFLLETKKRNLKIIYDCSQIPICFFSEEEQSLIFELGDNFIKFCEPVIDITPDFKATSCFGVYDTPIDCNIFNNITELIRYFQNQIFLRINQNNNSICNNCKKIKYLQCQGGCLSFSSFHDNFI